eukprot:3941604-Rhodomonas_salina.5
MARGEMQPCASHGENFELYSAPIIPFRVSKYSFSRSWSQIYSCSRANVSSAHRTASPYTLSPSLWHDLEGGLTWMRASPADSPPLKTITPRGSGCSARAISCSEKPSSLSVGRAARAAACRSSGMDPSEFFPGAGKHGRT